MQVETFKSTKDFLMSIENENTRKTYKKALRCFCKLLKIEDLDSLVENFNKSSKDGDDILKNFFNLMKENNFAPKTIASWSSAVKKFLAFNGIKTNFSPKIKVKTVFEDNIPNDEILKEIMENCELRTKAIMLLLLSGLSVKEILELKIKNFKKNEVPKIVFENGKVILITDDTAKTIEFYIKSRKEFGHEINEDSFLISTTDNRKLSYQTLQYLLNREFKKRVEKIGKRYRLRPTTLRKIFFEKISKTKIPKVYIENILGKRKLNDEEVEEIERVFKEEMNLLKL